MPPVPCAGMGRPGSLRRMKTSDCDILIVPGLGNSGPDHWQSRWERKLPTAQRVEQADWNAPDREGWVGTLCAAIAAARRPVVLVAHSLGCMTVALAAAELARNAVRGAFLVAPADVERPDMPATVTLTFDRCRRRPCPSPRC